MNKQNFVTIFLLNCISSLLCAQDSAVRIDNKEITLLDNSYTFKDTTQKIFLKNNQSEVWNLRQEITKLHFDHCNHNELNILLYSDTTGEIPFVQIITGTSLLKIDSTIISIEKSYSKKLKPVLFEGSLQRSLIYVKYMFHYRKKEEDLARTNGNYNETEVMRMFGTAIGNNETNECDDDAIFYDAGVKCFQQEDFSKAIYNFNQAVEANPWDWDAVYNLGLSYQKTDKLKKACDCFSKGIEAGDIIAVQAYNQFCSEMNNK
ncbi:MAG: tetratricopeptide repeat protein [Bacteroidetes bacterium]|nr:tetratricopeptide repeat protein [Bacteroidota bacterium]